MKYIIVIILLSVLSFGLFQFADFKKADEVTALTPVENPDSVIGYINKNISKLSPQKEVLGGNFYLTNITADAGTGSVSYEDGHNAYTADFTYEFSDSGEVVITKFEIIN